MQRWETDVRIRIGGLDAEEPPRTSCMGLGGVKVPLLLPWLAAPGLGGAKPDEVVTERRRAAEEIGRAYVVGGRVVPRPAAKPSVEVVSLLIGGLHRRLLPWCTTNPCDGLTSLRRWTRVRGSYPGV